MSTPVTSVDNPTAVNRPAVQTVETFLEREFPPKEPLIEGLLYRRDLITLGGRRRHGKTSLVSNFAAALALGLTEFLGWKIPSPGRVLMFYLEDDGGEIQSKLRNIFWAPGIPGRHIPAFSLRGPRFEGCDGRFALYTRDDFRERRIPINVKNAQFKDFVEQAAIAHKPDLITFDNLAHLVSANYNDSVLIHELMIFVYDLAANLNSAVMIAAHPRKRDKEQKSESSSRFLLRRDPEAFFEDIMGSSHLVNSTGSLWGIERDLQTNVTTFHGGAQRFTGKHRTLSLAADENDWFHVCDSNEKLKLVLSTDARRKVWAAFPGDFTFADAQKTAVANGMKSKSTLSEFLKALSEIEALWVEGDGSGRRWHKDGDVAEPTGVEE